MGDNGGARRDLSCCPWLLLWSLGALLLLRGSLLLPGSLLLLRADTSVQQVDARGLNASWTSSAMPRVRVAEVKHSDKLSYCR